MIFSDLGTPSVAESRGFSAYLWIRETLIARGVPASEIAFMQDFKRSAAKQRLFNDMNGGKKRILIGSSETMGTGVNAQQRLVALHHLDVPWLPSQVEQREGRIERQGNQNEEIELYAYATKRLQSANILSLLQSQTTIEQRAADLARLKARYESAPPLSTPAPSLFSLLEGTP